MSRRRAAVSAWISCLVLALGMERGVAEDVPWIGDQTGPFGLDKTADGWSFYEGTLWQGFRPPGFIYDSGIQPAPGDNAIFDSQYNLNLNFPGPPNNMGLGATVYFGDFVGAQNNTIQPLLFYDAQDAVNERLIVRNGAWTFDFGPGTSGGVGPPGPNYGSYTLTAQTIVGELPGNDATLTLRNGMMHSQFVTHIASDPTSKGTVIVDGPNTLWKTDSYIDLGWTGEGELVVQNGATFAPSGPLYIGISGPNAVGRLVIKSGGQLEAGSFADLGRDGGGSAGHLLITDPGSRAVFSGFVFAGVGGWGTVSVTQGAELFVNSIYVGNGSADVTSGGSIQAQDIYLNGPLSVSGLGFDSIVRVIDELGVGGYGEDAEMKILGGGTVESGRTTIGWGPDGSGTARVLARSSMGIFPVVL